MNSELETIMEYLRAICTLAHATDELSIYVLASKAQEQISKIRKREGWK